MFAQMNGWEEGVLQKAMKTCNVGNTAYPLDSPECFGAGSLYDDSVKNGCKIKPVVDEDVGLSLNGGFESPDEGNVRGGVLKALPGCNPIQEGPGNATPKTGCGATTSFSNGSNLGSKSPGNVVDTPSSPTTGKSTALANKVATIPTSSSTTLAKVATPVTPIVNKPITTTSSVSSPKETSTQTAGSSSGSTSGKTIKVSSGHTWTDNGCWSDYLNPRSLGTQPEWFGVQISGTNCADHCDKIGATISGTENGGQCFCGKSLTQSTSASASKCSTKCNGDSNQTCGGPGFLSVYKKTSGSSKKGRSHRHMTRHRAASS